MKNRLLTIPLLAVLLAPVALRAEPVQIDGVTAWVNGSPITVMDVLRDAQPQFGALQREKGLTRAQVNEKRVAIYNQVREGMIESELIYAWYEKQKQNAKEGVTDQMVDARINDIVQEEFGGSREKLMQALAGDRQTYEDWRNKMTRRFIVQSLRAREIMSKVQVTPQALKAYYDQHKAEFEHPGQVRLRRIALTGADAEARSQALQDRLAAGEEFASVAKSNGDPTGGLWGWREEADLSGALRDKLAIMRMGGVCRVNLEGDWYLVKLEGRNTVPYEDATADIEDKLRRDEAARLMGLWRERLERDFDVKRIEQSLFDE